MKSVLNWYQKMKTPNVPNDKFEGVPPGWLIEIEKQSHCSIGSAGARPEQGYCFLYHDDGHHFIFMPIESGRTTILTKYLSRGLQCADLLALRHAFRTWAWRISREKHCEAL
jgi:hypothetical protein